MSLDFINTMSDAELHANLLRHGFPNTPVTETTRQILIKKLKNQIRRERANNSRPLANTSALRLGFKHKNESNFGELSSQKISLSTYNENRSNPSVYIIGSNEKQNSSVPYGSSSIRTYCPPPVLSSESESDGENSIGFTDYRRSGLINCPLETLKYVSNTSNSTILSADSSGSNGGVVSRLLSLRGSTLQRKYKNKQPYMEYSKNDQMSRGGGRKFKMLLTRLTQLKKYFNTNPDFRQNIVPYVLIGAFVCFLLVIAVIYMSRRYDQGLINEHTVKYQLCNDKLNGTSLQYTNSCIDSSMLKCALTTNQKLFQLLEDRAKQHYCVDKSQSPMVKATELLQQVKVNNKPEWQNVFAVVYLISQNPQWNINVIRTLKESTDYNSIDHIEFELFKPNLSLRCLLFNKLKKFFVIVGIFGLVSVSTVMLYFCIQYVKNRNRDRRLAADKFTKDIVKELKYHSSKQQDDQSSELTIQELRDKLIPINKRSRLLWSWNEALRILKQSDSRVLFGIIMDGTGKEVQTLSWNGDVEDKAFSNKKKWQSPAFDNSNKIANPPTQCLKIRHMFDFSEVNHPNLRQLIIDAIYEKVGGQCNISDIQLDKQSCCVYVRCGSKQDAGIVHNEMNGWWFDKRLISIKFLRLERYMVRFPKSSDQPMSFFPRILKM